MIFTYLDDIDNICLSRSELDIRNFSIHILTPLIERMIHIFDYDELLCPLAYLSCNVTHE